MTFLFILLLLAGVALLVLIMLQDSKGDGLSALTGNADTFWAMNKQRSAEGVIKRVTAVFVAAFLVLCILLNMSFTERGNNPVVMDETEAEIVLQTEIVSLETEAETLVSVAEIETEDARPHIGGIM